MFKKQHGGSVLDVLDIVRFLADAVDEEEQERVRAACDRVEEFLSNTGMEIRDIVAIEMLESFPNAEYSGGSDTFAQLLGPKTKRLWVELQAIWKTSVKLDLKDRTVLGGEVLISRILRQLSFEHRDAGYADLGRLHS
jgi:hypothetical protein